MNVLDLDKWEQFVGLFVGDSGSGKTVALASFAKKDLANKKRTKLIDIDKRARGILGCRDLFPDEVLRNIDVVQNIDTSNGFADLDKDGETMLIYQKNNQFQYGTVIYESVSTMHKMLLYDSMRLRGAEHSFKGKTRGSVKFIHPDDYNYASMAFHQMMYKCWLPLKCNVILSGWIVDKWGKPPGLTSEENMVTENVVIGSKLLATDKFAAEIPGYFDEVYLFEKEETGSSSRPLKYTVQFETDLAKTSRSALRGLGKVDLTNKLFIDVYDSLIAGAEKKALIKK